MQMTRILPDLQCSLLCEQIRREASGNFFIIGIIDGIATQQLPLMISQLCVFNRWTAGVGQFKECVRLVAPDQTTVLHKSEAKFELKDPAQYCTIPTAFRQMEFKAAGTHFIEVLVDDVMKLRYPMPLVLVQPNPNPQPPPGRPAS